MAGTIVAIGGGQLSSNDVKQGYDTTAIDQAIVKLANKKTPKLLFLPTASRDSEAYIEMVQKQFGDKLGCTVNTLRLFKLSGIDEYIIDEILSSDIIYVGGGNTPLLIKIWKRLGIDKILKEAYEKGIILSGLSAGAMCWFRFTNMELISDQTDIEHLNGLNLMNFNLCPHHNTQLDLYEQFKSMICDSSYGIALDDYAAIVFQNDVYKVITSHPNAKVYLCYWKDGCYNEILMDPETTGSVKRLLQGIIN